MARNIYQTLKNFLFYKNILNFDLKINKFILF